MLIRGSIQLDSLELLLGNYLLELGEILPSLHLIMFPRTQEVDSSPVSVDDS